MRMINTSRLDAAIPKRNLSNFLVPPIKDRRTSHLISKRKENITHTHAMNKNNPGYSDEVAEECHDLIDRAEGEAHVRRPCP